MLDEGLCHLDSIGLAWLTEAAIGFVRVFLGRGASSDEESRPGFYVQVGKIEDDAM